MKNLEAVITPNQDRTLVLGAATIESTFKLIPGTHHEPDTTLTIVPVEKSYGGSGLCNALAYNRTGIAMTDLVTTGATVNGVPTPESLDIKEFLKKNAITPSIQWHNGVTEQTLIILSGCDDDPKRGFRTAQSEGTLLREFFFVDDQLRKKIVDYPLLIASSFGPKIILKLAELYKSQNNDSKTLFAWALNKESADNIGKDKSIQESILNGNIDIMFMSSNEQASILSHLGAIGPIDKIRTIVVTKGSAGCSIRDRLNGHTIELDIPIFDVPKYIKNDNGAGEAHHMNFLATLYTSQDLLSDYPNKTFRARVIEIAGNIGNLASYLKIQHPESLWFPSLDFTLLDEEIKNDKLSPKEIAKKVYERYLDSTYD